MHEVITIIKIIYKNNLIFFESDILCLIYVGPIAILNVEPGNDPIAKHAKYIAAIGLLKKA
tara:strand:+ start:761 stop:943 length:183 start_codon:yes stop_codon:yes gene_type:complete